MAACSLKSRAATQNVSQALSAANQSRSSIGLTIFYPRYSDSISGLNIQAITIASLQSSQRNAGSSTLSQALVSQSCRSTNGLTILRTIYQILAIKGYICIVVDLVDRLIQLLLDSLTICISISIVGCIYCLLLQSLQDIYSGAYSTLSNLHHRSAVLSIAISLIQRTNLHTHTLGNCITGSIVSSAVDLHTGRNLLQTLGECLGVLVQSVQSGQGGHVVFNYHCHNTFPPWLSTRLAASLLLTV